MSKLQIQPRQVIEQADAGRDGRTIARDTKLSGANGAREKCHSFSVHLTDHKQDWQPYLVDALSAERVIHPSVISLSLTLLVSMCEFSTINYLKITCRPTILDLLNREKRQDILYI